MNDSAPERRTFRAKVRVIWLALRAGEFPPFWVLIRRELVRTLRQVRTFVFLFLVFAVAVVAILVMYPENVVHPARLASASYSILVTLIWTLFAAAVLLLPGYGAIAIVGEREQNTFDMLALTLVKPSGIVFAKLINTMGLYVLLQMAALPLFATTFFLVGLDWQLVFSAAVVNFMAAVYCTCVGIFCSATLRTTLQALVLCYALILVLGMVQIPFAMVGYAIYEFAFSQGGSGAVQVLRTVVIAAALVVFMSSPVVALGALFVQGPSIWFVLSAFVGQSAICALLIWAATVALRRPFEPLQTLPVETAPRPVRMKPRRALSWNVLTHRFFMHRNAVFAREMRFGSILSGDGGLVLACLICGGLAYAAILMNVGIDPPYVAQWCHGSLVVWCGLLFAVAALVAPGLSAGLVAKEVDRDTLNLLRTTYMTSRAILWGKAAAALVLTLGGLLPSVLILPMLVPLLLRAPWGWLTLLTGYGTLITTVCLCVALGMWSASYTRTTRCAIILSYALTGAVLAGPLLLDWLADPFAYRLGLSIAGGEIVFLSPILSYFWAAGLTMRLGPVEHLVHWGTFTGVHALGCALIFAHATRRFTRKRMRDV